jgi:hypothetical protein
VKPFGKTLPRQDGGGDVYVGTGQGLAWGPPGQARPGSPCRPGNGPGVPLPEQPGGCCGPVLAVRPAGRCARSRFSRPRTMFRHRGSCSARARRVIISDSVGVLERKLIPQSRSEIVARVRFADLNTKILITGMLNSIRCSSLSAYVPSHSESRPKWTVGTASFLCTAKFVNSGLSDLFICRIYSGLVHSESESIARRGGTFPGSRVSQ